MPQPLSPADVALAAFLQSVELTVSDIYAPFFDAAVTPLSTIGEHHTKYASELGKLAGASAVHSPNQMLSAALSARLQAAADDTARMTFLFGMENQLAATYAFAATTATGDDLVHLISTIMPMCASRSALLGTLAKLSTPLLFPNGPVEGSIVGDGTDVRLGFDPALFPVS